MKPEFLANNISVYIEREISTCISFESIIDRLYILCSLNFE